MNYPVPVLGNKSKINQKRSIFQVVRGNLRCRTKHIPGTSCCFMVWLVWIYWHKFSLEISIWTFIRDISRTKTSVLKMMEFTVLHRAQSKANLAVETEKIVQSGNFYWNGEGHKPPNGVFYFDIHKERGKLWRVKLHWVCGKHFMNVDFHLSHYRQFSPKLRTQHTENGQSQRFPPIRKVDLRGWPLNSENLPASDVEPRLPCGDWLNERSAWVQRSPTQVNFADWRKL